MRTAKTTFLMFVDLPTETMKTEVCGSESNLLLGLGDVRGTHHLFTSFPPGVSHSIQALDTGIEFLVLFADGNFDGLGTSSFTFALQSLTVHIFLRNNIHAI